MLAGPSCSQPQTDSRASKAQTRQRSLCTRSRCCPDPTIHQRHLAGCEMPHVHCETHPRVGLCPKIQSQAAHRLPNLQELSIAHLLPGRSPPERVVSGVDNEGREIFLGSRRQREPIGHSMATHVAPILERLRYRTLFGHSDLRRNQQGHIDFQREVLPCV